jgi:ATP-binding cassette subfamily B protein AbcA/BmrA
MTTTKDGMTTFRKSKRDPVWGPFIRFYTRFKIPWWLFIVSFCCGILYTEVGVAVTEYQVLLNTGKLYNSAILGYAGFTLLMAIVSIATNMTSNYGSAIVTLRARTTIYRKIIYLPANIFESEQPSSYVSRITSDIPQASTTITYLSLFISSIYSFVRYYVILFQYSVPLTLWLLFAIPLAVIDFWLVGKTQFISQKKIYASINEMMTFFSEHLGAVKYFKAQAMEEGERENGYKQIEKRFRADMFYAFMSAVQTTITSLYTRACLLILVFSGRGLIEKGKLESTGINVGNTYLNNVQKYLAEILTQYQTIKGVQGSMTKVAEIAEREAEKTQEGAPMPENIEDIRVENVKFGYTQEKEVLHGISFTIPAGKKTAIVGNNGCGKSTLFKLLMQFYAPTEGNIYYGEKRIADMRLDEWRTSFGYVLQNSPLISGTIRDNIAYGCDREVSNAEIVAAARHANAYDFIMEFPEGFDKEVGEGGMLLSGGQRQRIAIARAMIVNPKVLLMDEATASLDYQSDRLIWEAAEKLMQGRTTILIAHDMNAVMSADNVVVMNSGNIEAVGTHTSLMKESPTYREYVSLQTTKGGAA